MVQIKTKHVSVAQSLSISGGGGSRRPIRRMIVIGIGMAGFLILCFISFSKVYDRDQFQHWNTLSLISKSNTKSQKQKSTQDGGISINYVPNSDESLMAPLFVQKEPGQCFRRCPQRINKIYYTNINEAGLYDRMYMIESLGNLAGYLCATLEFPVPHLMLGAWHNQGKKVSAKTKWNDFYNFTWIQDGTPTVVHAIADPYSPDYLSNPERQLYYQNWIQVTSTTPQDTLDHFYSLEVLSQHQPPNATTGFIWNIQVWFYDMTLYDGSSGLVARQRPWLNQTSDTYRMLPPMLVPWGIDGCWYVQSQPPYHMTRIVERIWEDILTRTQMNSTTTTSSPSQTSTTKVMPSQQQHATQQSRPTVGMFHVRRGDMQHECNTTLPKMKQYITCTLDGSERFGNIILLFASDERDRAYIQAVQEMVESYSHVTFIPIDDLVYQHVKYAVRHERLPKRYLNNFYVFRIQTLLQSEKVAFLIEQRRIHHCKDCDKLVERNNILWSTN